MTLTERDERRFWSKVAPPNGEGCMLWGASPDSKGYGQFRLAGKTVRAHRIAWLIATGEHLSSEVKLLHTCDTPLCVRVDHLRPGTQADNLADMRAKGRGRNGNSGKEQCGRGHADWYVRPNGFRNCRTCARKQKKARRAELVG